MKPDVRDLWSVLGFVVLLAGMIAIGGLEDPPPTPTRAWAPDARAALAECNDERAALRQFVPSENTARPWSERRPGDKTRRAR